MTAATGFESDDLVNIPLREFRNSVKRDCVGSGDGEDFGGAKIPLWEEDEGAGEDVFMARRSSSRSAALSTAFD